MKRWLPFIAGFLVCASVTWTVACEGGVNASLGSMVKDPVASSATAQSEAERVVREAAERAAAAEAARASAEAARVAAQAAQAAAEARANDASLTAEERAKAAVEAKAEAAKAKDAAAAAAAAEAERKRAEAYRGDMAALRAEIARYAGEVATLRNLPIPKGVSIPELIAWLLGTGAAGGGFLTWLLRAMGPNAKRLEELLAKAKAKTEEWDRETRMTMEDAAELAPLLAQLRAGAPPATGV